MPGPPASRSTPRHGRKPPARVLFLDDDPVRAQIFLNDYPHAVWVQTATECIARLSEAWDEVHLDHDLGGEQFVDHSRDDCGMEVVRWICLEPRPHLKATRFFVHSHNIQAATIMGLQMLANGFKVDVRPFGSTPEESTPDPFGEEPDPLLGPIQAFFRAVLRLFGRGPRTYPYGYGEYGRGKGDPPQRVEPLDLSWAKRGEPRRPSPRGGDAPPSDEPRPGDVHDPGSPPPS